MTRKDFVLIAATLKSTRPDRWINGPDAGIETQRYIQWHRTVQAFATELHSTNPLFKAQRFAAACGVEQDVEVAA